MRRENSGVSPVALDTVVFLLPGDGAMQPGVFKSSPGGHSLQLQPYNDSRIAFPPPTHIPSVSRVN